MNFAIVIFGACAAALGAWAYRRNQGDKHAPVWGVAAGLIALVVLGAVLI